MNSILESLLQEFLNGSFVLGRDRELLNTKAKLDPLAIASLYDSSF